MASREISLHPKNNSFFFKPIRNKEIPNTITTLFLGLQLIYGFNFGFIEILDKKLQPLCKCISYFMTFVVTTLIVLPFWFGFVSDILLFLNIIALVPYVSHTIFLHITKYKLCNFIKDIRIFERNISPNETQVGWFACLCLSLTCIFKFVAALYGCVLVRYSCANGNVAVYMLFFASSMGLDIIYIVQIIIYYYIYHGVKYLKRLVDDERVDLNAIRKQFVFIADCYDKVERLYGNLVSA